MSDFLSKFSGNKYKDLLEEDKKGTDVPTEKEGESGPEVVEPTTRKRPVPKMSAFEADPTVSLDPELASTNQKNEEAAANKEIPSRQEARQTATSTPPPVPPTSGRRDDFEEETEIDPTYQNKKKRKRLMFIGGAIAALLLVIFAVYQLTHVTIPDFVGKPVSELRAWGTKNGVDFTAEQAFNTSIDANMIVSQEAKGGSKVRKGSTVAIVVSKGADPEEVIALPDFSNLSASQAQSWIDENKASNLRMVKQFDEATPADQFMKLEITSSGVTASDYKRGDRAIVYYSRGPEVLEKNIDVPDFAGKTKADVETWVRSNEIAMTYTEQASNTIEANKVISQSITAGQKVAKKDKMEVVVSVGKGVTVPDFSQLSPDMAATVAGLTPLVKYQFSTTTPYGYLISQSIESGAQLTEKDDKNIVLIYSQGEPYLKDLTGKNNSELQKYFFDEFQAKGADVTYVAYYVDSSQPKGTVVRQSAYEQIIPLTFEVWLGISNGVYHDGSGGGDSSTSDTSSTWTNARDEQPKEEKESEE